VKLCSHTDPALFQLVASGSESAFTELFYRHSDAIFAYALKLVRSTFYAEEVVQLVFMQLWQHRESLSAVTHPKSYIFKMAANRSIDILRSHEKQIRSAYLFGQQIQNHSNPDEKIDCRETENILQQAIHQLPEKRKLIYYLKNAEGLSYDEISRQLQVSPHTVRNQLARAAQTIREYLGSHGVTLFVIGSVCPI